MINRTKGQRRLDISSLCNMVGVVINEIRILREESDLKEHMVRSIWANVVRHPSREVK